jgi:Flp pilus assembly protein TadG
MITTKITLFTKTQRYHSSHRGKRCGVAVVEFALIVPILLALVMGILEWGWLARTQLTVANAAREGVRHAVLGNSSTSVRTRIVNAAAILNPQLTTSQIILTQTPDRTNPNPTYFAWPADTTGTPPRNTVPAGNIIRVQVNYTHRSLTGFFPFMNNRNVSSTVSMAREATG